MSKMVRFLVIIDAKLDLHENVYLQLVQKKTDRQTDRQTDNLVYEC